MVFDCRFLPNPHWVDELRPLTGLDDPVREYVLQQVEAQEFLAHLDTLFALLVPAFVREESRTFASRSAAPGAGIARS